MKYFLPGRWQQLNNINTVKMVRGIREKQYNEIKNKSNEEIIKYFKVKSRKLRNSTKQLHGTKRK